MLSSFFCLLPLQATHHPTCSHTGLSSAVHSLIQSIALTAQAEPLAEHKALAQQQGATTPSTSQMGAMEEGKLAHRARQEERWDLFVAVCVLSLLALLAVSCT